MRRPGRGSSARIALPSEDALGRRGLSEAAVDRWQRRLFDACREKEARRDEDCRGWCARLSFARAPRDAASPRGEAGWNRAAGRRAAEPNSPARCRPSAQFCAREPSATSVCTSRCAVGRVMPVMMATSATVSGRSEPAKASRIVSAFRSVFTAESLARQASEPETQCHAASTCETVHLSGLWTDTGHLAMRQAEPAGAPDGSKASFAPTIRGCRKRCDPPYFIACGLIGEPVPPEMISGGPQKKNS